MQAKSSNAVDGETLRSLPSVSQTSSSSTASRASAATPTPSVRASSVTPAPSSNPPINTRVAKRAKAHVFSPDEELYMAELLADPETWSLLDGPGEKNDYNRPKKVIHEEIAQKVNSRFSTEGNPVELDATQIKNKIEHMKKQWKAANVFNKKTGNGDTLSSRLREKILEKCVFFFVVEETWSSSWSLNPRPPIQLIEDLVRPSSDSGNDASDEEAETAVEQDDVLSEQESPSVTKKGAKRKQGDGERFITLINNLSKSSEKEYDLKRQKLDLDQKTSLTINRKAEMESLLIGAQIKKIEMEIDIAKRNAEAEIARQDRLVEIELIKAKTELLQAENYHMQEVTKLERAKRIS
ncbi:hypothetical protein BGZ49_004873, partial [Haplosporangium sp. Z 27]